MDEIERRVRRASLGPLVRRAQGTADQEAIIGALTRLDERALGQALLKQVRYVLLNAGSDKEGTPWKDPAKALKSVLVAKALYFSRQISNQEYVFFAASPVETIHDSRWTDGKYDFELNDIKKRMKEIEEKYEIGPDEYLPLNAAPKEFVGLNKQYGDILDEKFTEVLREFGLDDLADLNKKNPREFARLRERGRRTVTHRDEHELAIRDVVIRYEHDARRAASVQAFSAAVTSLGAGVEGLLLLRCLRSRQKASRIANELPKRLRPRKLDDPTTWTFEALIETCLNAGWLPPIETSLAKYNSAGLAHVLRLMRNHVHPGRHARDRPWVETDEREYQDAEAIYVILLSALGKVSRAKFPISEKQETDETSTRPVDRSR